MLFFYIFILFIGYFNQFGTCCQCRESTETQYFCRAGFVIRANVTEKAKPEGPKGPAGDWEYTVVAIEIYKGKELFKSNETKITTPSQGGMCGSELATGAEYLLSGGSSFHTDMCQWHRSWEYVPESLVNKLEQGVWNCTDTDHHHS